MGAGSSGSLNASMSKSKEKTTVLTSLSGGTVTIDVEDNTNLKGVVISSSDSLSLTTNTLTTANLSNTKNSRNVSIGGSTGSTVSGNLGIGSSNSKSKTLATITSGDINVKDTSNSTDISKLNRDKNDVNLDLYDVKSDVSVSAEVDTRLLSEGGRKKIAEDIMVSGMIADTIKQIATNDTVGITDFFSNTNQEVKTYDGVKEAISKDPKLVALLNNPDITDAQKEQMMDTITDSVMIKLGYKDSKPQNKLIDTTTAGRDDKQVKGFHSTQTNDSYINTEYVKDNEELVKVAGTEMQRAIDNNVHKENGTVADQSDEYRDERSKYSQHRGDNVASYTNFALDMTGQGSISNKTNTYQAPKVTSTNSVFNNSSITSQNNSVFDGLDKSQGDNRALSQEEKKHIDSISKNAHDKYILTQTAEYMVDKDSNDKINENFDYVGVNFFTKKELEEAQHRLVNTSKNKTFIDTYKEDMTQHQMFTSTQNQFNNSDYTPSNTIGLGDGTVVVLPATRIGVTGAKAIGTITKEVTPLVTKKTGQVYDDVTFEMTNQLLKISPKAPDYTKSFIDGFDAKYPKPDLKFPFINPQTIGYGTRKVIKTLGE